MTRRFHIAILSLARALAGLFLCVLVVAPSTTAAEDAGHEYTRSGAEVFQQACFSCHGTGFYGAPVIGDLYAWEERLLKGEAVLIESTLQGLNSMPARGGCAQCSDADIQAAVHYLIDN